MDKEKNKLIGAEIQAVPKDSPEIGINTDDSFTELIIDATEASSVDLSKLENFTTVTSSREQIYKTIETMTQDSVLSAVLRTYVEDSVCQNDAGQRIWVESSDKNVSTYVSFLLDSLNIDKKIYSWAYSLVKYGDVYVKLFRESDDKQFDLFKDQFKKENTVLNEDVIVRLHKPDDKYKNYVEMVANPASMFELDQFGKIAGYICAPSAVTTTYNPSKNTAFNYLQYQFNKQDVELYDADEFVHGCLEDNTSRIPEKVDLFIPNTTDPELDTENIETKEISYTVKRGNSLFADVFKIWRELSLIENSIMLTRLTKSSIVRVLNVDIGDMGKEQTAVFMNQLKNKIEQKTALNTDKTMSEYTNPGPIENTIYVPTHEGKGQITATTLGGDVDPKQLTDLEYFRDKLFASLGVPKQFFGFTDDAAGFNGGSSLSIISSRYGKTIKRIQSVLCQLVTDLINLFLIDRGLSSYVNNFVVKMQEPVTQEELDKREAANNKIRYIGDIMNQLSDIQTPSARLKVLKSLLSTTVNDPEIISVIQEEIEKLEDEEKSKTTPENEETDTEKKPFRPTRSSMSSPSEEKIDIDFNEPEAGPEVAVEVPETPEEGNSYLPSPDELSMDMTNNG